MSKIKRFMGAVGVVTLVGGFLLPGAANAEGCSPVSLETLDVGVEAARPVYSVGQTAKFNVAVNRHAAGVDLMPVSEVDVLVAVTSRGVSLGGRATTDADGQATVLVKLAKHMKAGVADVRAVATREPAHCAQETGQVEVPGLIRISR